MVAVVMIIAVLNYDAMSSDNGSGGMCHCKVLYVYMCLFIVLFISHVGPVPSTCGYLPTHMNVLFTNSLATLKGRSFCQDPSLLVDLYGRV